MAEIVSLSDRRQAAGRKTGSNRKGSRRSFGYLRKLPSGRWQASYLAPDGQRHNAPTTFLAKGDADAWLAMQSAAITEHRWKPAPPTPATVRTVGDYATHWLAGRDLKPRTRAEYSRLIEAKIAPTLGSTPLAELTAADVRGWHADQALWTRTITTTGKRGKKTTETVPAPTTRAHAYALLRTILNAAVDEELIAVNPARIRSAGAAKRARSIRPATLEELAAITATMPAKYRLMVDLASWCALRYGEIAELRRSDIDLRTSAIRVRRAVTWPDGQPVVGTPKSDAGVRDVTIPPHLVPTIRQHLEDHAAKGRDGLIFPNTNGQHLHHGSLYKVYKPARAKANRPDLRWHDLRHTGATLSAQTGATVRELMDRLGHSTPTMALRYQHVADGRAAEIARRLSDIATGSKQP